MFAALAVRSVTSKGQKAALSPKSLPNETVKLLLFTRSKHLVFLSSCFLRAIVSSTEWISPCHPGNRSWSCAVLLFAKADSPLHDDRITSERRARLKTIVKRITVARLVKVSLSLFSLSLWRERAPEPAKKGASFFLFRACFVS
jgi:hypothetical protein